MRVTNWMLLNSAMYDMAALRERYADAQKKVYGRSLERPSDDPQKVVEALDLTGTKVRLERAQTASTDAKEWLSIAETSLSAMADYLTSAEETAVQFGSPSNQEPVARENLARTIEGLRDAILREFNSEHRDRYLFAGWATDKQPFVDNGAGGVTYAGGNQKIEREIAPGYKVSINVPGDQLPSDIIQNLTDMAAEIRAGDQEAVTTTRLGQIKAAFSQVVSRRSDIGLSMQQVEQFEQYTSDDLISIQERLGVISGGDLPEAVMRMTEAQQSYQAALSAFSKALPISLLDYMNG